jgi:aquaporin NIP
MTSGVSLWRRATVEAMATFALVFAGSGAIVADAHAEGALGPVGVSLGFELIVMAMIFATSHLSGAHVNPAVTTAFVLTRHLPARDATAYITAQLAGAAAAALTLLAISPGQPADLARLSEHPSGRRPRLRNRPHRAADVRDYRRRHRPPSRRRSRCNRIGGTLALDALFGGPVTGASMNPARSFGPALASGQWSDLWIYVVGRLVGAALGAFAYQLVRGGAPGATRASDPQTVQA